MGCLKLDILDRSGTPLKVVCPPIGETRGEDLVGVKEGINYYPFGMAWEASTLSPWFKQPEDIRESKYQYNGKELSDEVFKIVDEVEIGLNVYEYGARVYSPDIGRFTGVDPISDQFAHLSTYNYAGNGPISNIDLHGLQSLFYVYADALTGGKLSKAANAVENTVKQMYSDISNELSNPGEKLSSFPSDMAHAVNSIDGEIVGNGLQDFGDAMAMVGYMGAGFTEGASLALSVLGETVSLIGTGIETGSKFLKNGASNENLIDLGIDVGFELLPTPIENLVEKSSLDKVAKEVISTQMDKTLMVTERVIESKVDEKREN